MSKIYKVKWTTNAKEDLLNIVDYFKKDNLSVARKVYGQIVETHELGHTKTRAFGQLSS